MKVIITFIFILFISLPSFAGGVGYINYDKVVQNYQFAKNTLMQIEVKNNEIKQYLMMKENEFNKLESAVQKQKFEATVQAELRTKEQAFNDFRERKEEEVYNRIHAVSEKIRLEKGLDAIIDARSVFSGGVDITNDLIQKLNNKLKSRDFKSRLLDFIQLQTCLCQLHKAGKSSLQANLQTLFQVEFHYLDRQQQGRIRSDKLYKCIFA